jgi:putative ABC transport system ATP-binding protein
MRGRAPYIERKGKDSLGTQVVTERNYAADPLLGPALITLDHVHKTYQMGDVEIHALRGASLHIDRGEFVAIMGASGSGKSTTMNILGCLDKPTRGSYFLDGQDVSAITRRIGGHKKSEDRIRVSRVQSAVPNLGARKRRVPMLYLGVKTSERLERARSSRDRGTRRSFE